MVDLNVFFFHHLQRQTVPQAFYLQPVSVDLMTVMVHRDISHQGTH